MLGLYGSIGCLGMSAVIMFANGLIALAVSDRQHRLTCLFVAGAVVLTILGVGAVRNSEGVSNSRLVRVAVIQANISPLQKMDLDLFDRNVLLHLHLTQEAFHQGHPDLYIWPETAYPDDLWQSDQWRPVVADQARRMNADILLGDAPIIDGEEYNSALLIGSKGQMAGLYHKQALVPFAETTPFEAWGWRLGRGYHFRAGDKPGILSLKDGIRFGVVICSESAHPSMVRDLKKSNVRFLVELSNDGWFKDKASCMLHAQAAVMRAVENHLWVIRAANTGASFAVDPSGRIHSRANLKLGREGFGIFDIMIGDIKWADTRSAPTDKFEGRLD